MENKKPSCENQINWSERRIESIEKKGFSNRIRERINQHVTLLQYLLQTKENEQNDYKKPPEKF